jgi:hypothetical protein
MTAALEVPRVPREVPDWHALGACRQYPQLNFADPGNTGDAFDKPASVAERRAAEYACRRVCAECPFRLPCAIGGLERRERWGVWGGLTYDDRKALAGKYGYLPPGDPPPHGTNSRRVKWGCTCRECKDAHARYEAQRREKRRAEARARNAWRTPVVLAVPVRAGRTRALPGQFVLPLQIVMAAGAIAA